MGLCIYMWVGEEAGCFPRAHSQDVTINIRITSPDTIFGEGVVVHLQVRHEPKERVDRLVEPVGYQ